MRLLQAATKAEVVRNALKLYEWFITQIEVQFRIPVKVLLS